jgi:GxxExxY protein
MEHLITRNIIGAAIEVHRRLGPGLLESTYEMCLAQEFKCQNIPFERQRSYPLIYRGTVLESAYRIDFLVENQVVVEIKAIETISKIHVAQLLTYLRLLNLRNGLILNFNVPALKDGIKRVSNEKRTNTDSNFEPSATSAFSASLR